ncbi:hypothetical protein GIB67_039991 [Kingdonia uniflora]|uniref:Uncharacterized protein n=1 Tax=Kingdonia uniflora TaxID=39325 RepID=A0A7J7LIE5_9MAGN|nr:hypothetical protein GIB67_039991 [Kingdonia uniflora]
MLNSATTLYPCPSCSYEEVAQNAQLFMETLDNFHNSLSTKFMVPTMGGKSLDLHRLFLEVTSRGGLETVIRNRQWREIINAFNFPPTITNASFVLRKYYISLLHHYEHAYYFRRQGPPIKTATIHVQPVVSSPKQDQPTNSIHSPENSEIWTGRWVNGTIDGKFDNGYLVTMSFGSEKLKGVLYHIPIESHASEKSTTSNVSNPRGRKRAWVKFRDPTRPRPSRSGYNFYYSEHYNRLKSLYRGQEKTISTKIAQMWSELPEDEKQVYREKGVRDKERYQREMLEFKNSTESSNHE